MSKKSKPKKTKPKKGDVTTLDGPPDPAQTPPGKGNG